VREPFVHWRSLRQLELPRLGLAAAGGLMIAGAFFPCLEIFGESESAFTLAVQGAAFPWLWIILALPLLLPASLWIRSPLFGIVAGLSAAIGPIAALTTARYRFGPVVWQTLRSGSWLLLVGAMLGLCFAASLAARRWRRAQP
jgi:hypothetical protein